MAKTRVPDISAITEDTPLRLSVAASLAFPDGSLGVPGLRKEIERGRLDAEMIAGKIYVTLAGIRQMRERCRIRPKVPVPNMTLPASSDASRMEAARAALRAKLDELKSASKKTPPQRTKRGTTRGV